MGGPRTSVKRWWVVAVAAIALVASADLGTASAQPIVRSDQHVVICHALGNGGFVRLDPAVDNVVHEKGHSAHANDVIPPFDYTLANGTTGHFPGLNWDDAGQAIWNNGCVRPPPPNPEQINVFVACADVGASTYTATFGYQSNNTVDVTIAASAANNGFSPEPFDRGQVTVFHPGTVGSAFQVTGIPVATALTWTVSYAGHTSRAIVTSAFGTACTQPPPPPVGVFVRCVTNHGGTYDATFGYQNDGTSLVVIQVGAANAFTPGPENRGQPESFLPGNVQAAVTVTGIPVEQDLQWSLTSDETRTATASAADEQKCDESPGAVSPIGVFVTCVVNHGSTYDAVFGYESDNFVAQTVPIGEANSFSPLPADRGQPTTFLPSRVEEAVGVEGIPSSVALTWTLAFAGTRSATATAAFATKCSEPVEPPETGGSETPEPPGPLPPDPPGVRPPVPPRPVGIFASCVVNNGRTYDATFGYVNVNVGDVIIPTGPDNAMSPGRHDQGQPQTFGPGFVDAAFTVRGVSANSTVTWTLRFGGETRVASATATFANKCLTAPITPVADLTLSKSATPQSAFPGERVTFTISAHNPGTKVVGPFTVTDSLPRSQLTVDSVTSDNARCRTRRTSGVTRVNCTVGALAPGDSLSIRVVARTSALGRATDHASIIGVPHDATPHNNVAAATVNVVSPPPPPPPGLGLGLG